MKEDRKLQEKLDSAHLAVKSTIHPSTEPKTKTQPIIYEQIPIGIVASSLQGEYLDANEEFCRIVGYEKEQLLGRGIKDLVFEQDYPVVISLYHQLAEGKIPFYTLEKRYVRKDGKIVWVEAKRSLVRTSDGRALYTIGAVLDVSERKQAEEKYRRIVETANEGIWEIDQEARTVFINAHMAKMLGYTVEEMMGRSPFEFVFPEDHVEGEHRLEHAKQGIPTRSNEFRYRRKDGSELWTLVSSMPKLDAQGNFLGSFAMFSDITEWKKAEEALRDLNLELENRIRERTIELQAANQVLLEQIEERKHAEELLRSWAHIFEHADWGIATIFQDRFVMVNPTFAKMHGYKVDKLIGRSTYDVLSPECHAETRKQIDIAYKTGHHVYENIHIRKDGSTFPALVDTSVVRDSQGNVLYRAINIQDITERKLAEEALRESEYKLKEAERIAHIGYWEHDYQTNRITWSAETYRIAGISPEEQVITAAHAWELVHPEDRQRVAEVYDHAKRSGSRFNIEYRVVRPNGEARIIHTEGDVTCDESGQPRRIFGVLRDITERKQAEKALVESRQYLQMLSKRLVEVQEEERRAIARELHDRVGQNLSALKLNLTMMENPPPQDSMEHSSTRLKDSVHLVDETTKLVRDLLNELRPTRLDDYGLKAALRAYIEEFTLRYNIRVALDVAPKLPRFNPSLEITLLRIAQEALTNIARYAQADQAMLSLRLENNTIYLTVLDNGIGVEASQGKAHHVSHGIKIMRERAEAFGGTVIVGQADGKGTKVEAVIPIAITP